MFVPVFFVAWLALLIFALLDIDRSPADRVRTMAGPWWVVVVVLVPIGGSLAWIAAGRPHQAQVAQPATGGSRLSPEVPEPLGRRPDPARGAVGESVQAKLDRIDREFDEAVRRRKRRASDERPEQ